MEELDIIIETTQESMQSSLNHLEVAFTKIRAGRPTPAVLQDVKIEYYGAITPIAQVASITVPDGMTLSIQPWEKSTIPAIERAIFQANLGFTPTNNGEFIIINIPPQTEERRKELVKQAKIEVENAKVGIRKARQEANGDIKKAEGASEDAKKVAEEKVQILTDKFSKLAEEILAKKEKEIMTV